MKTSQVSHEPQGKHNLGTDSTSASACSTDGRKVSRQDIELVQNLIERCLQLYMNRDEVVQILLARARIDPSFTTLVWRKLEEENAGFFRAYYIRLKLKKQILLFNHFLEHQYNMTKHPVNNMPMGYPVMQLSPMPAPGHPCHVVGGVPATGGYRPIRVKENTTLAAPPTSEKAPLSPASAASSGDFPFNVSGMGIESSPLDHIPWDFNLSDLTADVSPIADLGSLGIYPGSPFLHSDSEVLLASPVHEDIGT